MKGKMKKILALALATVMLLAMGMTASATEENPEFTGGTSENESYNLTITNPVDNHVYKVYQIYTGTVSENTNGNAVLSDIKKGSAWSAGVGDKLTSAEVVALKEKKDAVALAKEYSSMITENTKVAAILTKSNITASLPGGYYLVKDEMAEGQTLPAGQAYSDFVISIVGATSFAPKTLNVPVFNKTAEGNLTVISDKKVGDTISFTLTATLPSSFGSYDKYKVVFNDNLSEGLTYAGNFIVTIDGNKIDAAPTMTTDGKGFTYEIGNVFDIIEKDNAAGKTIVVTYDAKINDNAMERTGETNTATLNYTNGPDDNQMGSSTPSTVPVLLAKLQINKIDGDTKEGLGNAGFALYNYVEDEKDYVKNQTPIKEIKASPDNAEFIFGGLGKGTYVLVETETPEGYNTMDPISITIDFTGGIVDSVYGIKELTVTSSDENKWTPNTDSIKTIATANVANFAGVELPSTGGIGTTIFYVVGGILVLGACVLLVTKKRMSARD